MAYALPYQEPGIIAILVISSCLLLLNAVNYVLDKFIYCGLIGQIFIGVGWGVPGANWLSIAAQQTATKLGYLGLILIVYEGGLSTSIRALRAHIQLSLFVAAIGISAPIGFSFALIKILDVTPLQAFAAGAALCSTSLGTTFTVLSTSGLTESRLGVILASAAMIDDVVGLVMVQVIVSLGQSSSSFDAVTVVRPIGVSLAFAVFIPVICAFMIRPLTKWSYKHYQAAGKTRITIRPEQTLLIFHTSILLAFVAGSSYAGTSNLFGAYIAGAAINWWTELCGDLSKASNESSSSDSTTEHADQSCQEQRSNQPSHAPGTDAARNLPDKTTTTPDDKVDASKMSGTFIYEHYYAGAVSTILKPLFFASIGFSIPIRQMFSGNIVWRGIVYAVLMTLGKLLCGLALVRLSGSFNIFGPLRRVTSWIRGSRRFESRSKASGKASSPFTEGQRHPTDAIRKRRTNSHAPPAQREKSNRQTSSKNHKPVSLYPAAILGCAMVARGEIGFLISSVAEANGVLGAQAGKDSSDLFLVVTWAILLCTLFGPITVGLLVKRVKRMQAAERTKNSGREDPLGVWGFADER